MGYVKQSMRGKENSIQLLFERLKERYHAGKIKENGGVGYKYIIKFEVVQTCSWYLLCRSSDGHSMSRESEKDTDKQINSGPVPPSQSMYVCMYVCMYIYMYIYIYPPVICVMTEIFCHIHAHSSLNKKNIYARIVHVISALDLN